MPSTTLLVLASETVHPDNLPLSDTSGEVTVLTVPGLRLPRPRGRRPAEFLRLADLLTEASEIGDIVFCTRGEGTSPEALQHHLAKEWAVLASHPAIRRRMARGELRVAFWSYEAEVGSWRSVSCGSVVHLEPHRIPAPTPSIFAVASRGDAPAASPLRILEDRCLGGIETTRRMAA